MFRRIHVLRVMPKQDLLHTIQKFCEEKNITSGVIIGIIGSLERASLNFLKTLPSNYINKQFEGPLEIVSGQGSVATHDGKTILHVHLTVSNEKGANAGHLAEGSIVFSTAEVIIGELEEQLIREKDEYTGLLELKT